MSLNTKAAALIFLLAFLLNLPGIRRRLQFAGGFCPTVLIGSMPYIAQEPRLILGRMSAYQSIYGH